MTRPIRGKEDSNTVKKKQTIRNGSHSDSSTQGLINAIIEQDRQKELQRELYNVFEHQLSAYVNRLKSSLSQLDSMNITSQYDGILNAQQAISKLDDLLVTSNEPNSLINFIGKMSMFDSSARLGYKLLGDTSDIKKYIDSLHENQITVCFDWCRILSEITSEIDQLYRRKSWNDFPDLAKDLKIEKPFEVATTTSQHVKRPA